MNIVMSSYRYFERVDVVIEELTVWTTYWNIRVAIVAVLEQDLMNLFT